ncbi:MAG: threonine--tRNA ligase [Clostridiaceae bacterium]|nr:threonine--tRNA ligase [Eubacteriales bacterium]NLB44982.1 threonine--tRNA ligase [Clostridiaceae bacterium]
MPDFTDSAYRQAFRHTSSHILAHAVKQLFPETRLAIGPAIEDGFYYDFDREEPFTPDDLKKIEDEMKKIVKANLPLERFELPRAEARQLMLEKEEPYKVELIDELPEDAVISFYRQGDFTDLCAGPHLEQTGQVKAFKLTQVAGAYWRGSEKNKMLQRIYGTSFPDKGQLNDYLQKLEEARKRDHNKLGRELGFFTTTEYIGQGLPIMLPKGARVLQLLQRFVEDEEEKRGYLLTKTPLMAKSDLYKISGHWYHYRDGMFIMGDPEKADTEEVLALRPMTCPFQFQAYLTRTRSYRDLPIRYAETSTLFRNESSGEMHGLIRLRQFTISEGHIVCAPDQLEREFRGSLDLAAFMLRTIGLDEDVSYRFSTWDPKNREKYIGSEEQWDAVQETMKNILDHMGLDYTHGFGEAAFYGPKLDIQIRNVFGKEDTLITIQIDFQLAERFEMFYTDRDGSRRHPIIIHRTSIGCYERTLALLIEKYAGALPLWMAPEQARILPISERHLEEAGQLADKLRQAGLRVTVDDRDEKIGKKIREGQMDKLQYMLILGDQEVEQGTISVRSRLDGELGVMPVDSLIERLRTEVAQKRNKA